MTNPTAVPGQEDDHIWRWPARHPYWTLTLVVLAALVPFLAKPFNIDEPLFLWTARQIQAHPGNPYGFSVNWYGGPMPMWDVTKNPPLGAYYLALGAKIFGWSEIGLHTAFLLPALAAAFGIYRLARRFCQWPLLATLVTLFTPAFFVSATSVMCDVMMLAFWVWAMELWLSGMKQEHPWKLTAAGLLIGLAALTKYYGGCLILLLAAGTLIKKRRLGWWAIRLLIPVLMLYVYQLATVLLYGHPLFASAADYTQFVRGQSDLPRTATILAGFTFTGGCLAAAFFFAPLLWRTRLMAIFAVVIVLFFALAFIVGTVTKKYDPLQTVGGSLEVQIIFWFIAGAWVLALAFADLAVRRDADSALLNLWVFGTFVFAVFVNWITNSRSLLPMVPAVGILVVRSLERTVLAGRSRWPVSVWVCLLAGAGVGWMTARAEYQIARADRDCAQHVWAKYGHDGKRLWFEGHWGFQYYLQGLGGTPVDVMHSPVAPGDHLAIPSNNSNVFRPDPNKVTLRETFSAPGPAWLTTWNVTVGAAFHASVRGPVPFYIGSSPPESVTVFDIGHAPATKPAKPG